AEGDRGKTGGQIFHDRMEFLGVVLLKNRQTDVGRGAQGRKNGGDFFLFQKLFQLLDGHIGFRVKKNLDGKWHSFTFNDREIKKPLSISGKRLYFTSKKRF